jgi:hypothetical protein
MRRLPGEILDIFRDVDLILHAGDVDRIEFLSDLAALAPLHAVRGNLHFIDLSDGGRDLPVELQLMIAGQKVVVNHGGWSDPWMMACDWFLQLLDGPSQNRLNRRIASRLSRLYPQADVILFGHTHRPYRAWHNGTLIFNPGAVCPSFRRFRSVGKLNLGPDMIEAEVIPLA